MVEEERLRTLQRHLRGDWNNDAGEIMMMNCLNGKNVDIEQEKDQLLYQVLDGNVAVITLNRPKKGNSLTQEGQALYFDLLEKADADERVRVIIVTGNGKLFCAGADMQLLNGIDGSKGQKQRRDVAHIQHLKIRKPVIAAINGSVAGLGMVLALWTDIRFCTRKGKWTTAFAKRGLIVEHGMSWTLPRIVGLSNAMDLILSSRVIQGDEAKEMGLVSKVFDGQEELFEYTLKYAREMAAQCSPASLLEMKEQVYRDAGPQTPQAAHDNFRTLLRQSFKHPDFAEGVKSYNDRRDPAFQGLRAGRIKDIKLDN